ncbi:MAG: hypothetical protein AAF849_09055, partial [Bacteroidota bacterium]
PSKKLDSTSNVKIPFPIMGECVFLSERSNEGFVGIVHTVLTRIGRAATKEKYPKPNNRYQFY